MKLIALFRLRLVCNKSKRQLQTRVSVNNLIRDDFTHKFVVLQGKLAVHGCLAVHDRSFDRSPQKSVAVHPKSPWPFTSKVRGRSPKKFVAVHLISPIGCSLKIGVLFRIDRSFSPFSQKWTVSACVGSYEGMKVDDQKKFVGG